MFIAICLFNYITNIGLGILLLVVFIEVSASFDIGWFVVIAGMLIRHNLD